MSNILSFIFLLPSLLIAITIHEFAHAAMADRLGDPTPRLMGRLTLNPLAHLDPIGTLLLFFLILSNSSIVFGWGKPVPIDIFNLRNPRRDSALISLAGPAANLILAVLLSLFLRLPFIAQLLNYLITSVVFLNIVLAIFNLLPIHPLDGFKIVHGFLPQEQADQWEELRSLGPLILFLLIFPLFGQSLISTILGPVINFFLQILIPYGYTGV